MHIYPLEHKLYISSFQRSDILKYLYVIIERAFIVPSNDRFICYTETDEEVSLIMDERSMDVLDQYEALARSNGNTNSSLVECSTLWRAIRCQLSSSSSLSSKVGIRGATTVKQLASCLSERDISIMYVSLYDSELILVEEDKFDLAMQCLTRLSEEMEEKERQQQQLQQEEQKVENDEKNDEKKQTEEEEEKDDGNNDVENEEGENKTTSQVEEKSNHVVVAAEKDETKSIVLNEELQMDVTVLENNVLQALRFCTPHSFQYHNRTLLDMLFFYKRKYMGAFLSLTSFGDCHMLIARAELIQDILRDETLSSAEIQVLLRQDQQENNEPCTMQAVRIDEGALGFEETGIAARFAGALDGTIPILYCSTFLTDYCIIESARLDQALECLEKQSYRITHE